MVPSFHGERMHDLRRRDREVTDRVMGRGTATARIRGWRRAESNRGPRDYETLALAN